jgi:Fur family transcriptional regulator, iron response regulator
MAGPELHSDAEIARLLIERGVNPTQQRILITRTLFAHGTHLAAEDVFRAVNADSPSVSKATVYNTLGLLASKGMIREVIADPARVFYDPNTAPHHHLYDEVSGELTDIDAKELNLTNPPSLPEGTELAGVDIVVRVRGSKR